jgi:CHAT domain-containing protein
VVLSACDTALGRDINGEGIVGLTRGFMYAGAPRVVATLWDVDDEATSEFMKWFYFGILQRQESPTASMREAQMEVRKQARWRSPYYWGAFIIEGDWRTKEASNRGFR